MTTISAISHQIWDMKYRLRTAAGDVVDKTIEDTWSRVANALADPENPAVRDEWAEKFAAGMADFRFLPAGRIVAGAGTDRDVTLFNCFVMGIIPDDMSGIFEHLRRSRADHAAGRWHRVRFFDPPSQGRARPRCRCRCIRSAVVYGCLGFHVPHHYVGRASARCHDGDTAL